MDRSQPGVIYSESIVRPAQSQVETAVPVFIGYTEKGDVGKLQQIYSMSGYYDIFGGPPSENAKDSAVTKSILYHTVRHYFDNGGNQCYVCSLSTYTDASKETIQSFISRLSDNALSNTIVAEQKITLVAVPDMVLLDVLSSSSSDDISSLWGQVWIAVQKICEKRLELFGVLECPPTVDITLNTIVYVVKRIDAIKRQKIAAYWPRLITSYEGDKSFVTSSGEQSTLAALDNTSWLELPPSGAVIAKMVYVDFIQGIWTAPANIALAHVIKPKLPYSLADKLFVDNGVSVNLIRSFPGRGVRVWGTRTLSDGNNLAGRYIQIRRLLDYIELSVSELGRFCVFEPNNELTWMKLKGQTTSWLRDLWQKGGLAGVQESDAFRVLIGLDETMTEQDRLLGKMIMKIYVSVLQPVEFIEISLEFQSSETEIDQQSARTRNASTII